jgi:hypothetical protein
MAAYSEDVQLSLGPANAGLVLKAHIYNVDGSAIAGDPGDITAGFVEQANGDYVWSYANFPNDTLRYLVKFFKNVGGAYMGRSIVSPDDARIAAIRVKTDNLPATPANETTVAAVKTKTDNLPADPASNTQVNTRAAPEDIPAPYIVTVKP